MLTQIIWLLIILSFEATMGLPLFFMYLGDRFLGRLSERLSLFAVFGISLCLAIFYNLSWPIMSAILLVWYFLRTAFTKQTPIYIITFIILQISLFFLASLTWHYFYLLHLAFFIWYLVKFNFRKYAS